jgi:hypothetical protein
MLDSVDVAHLPDGADAYAGYTTGLFPTWGPLTKRFHGKAHLLSIAINAAEHALCLDIENGDATPAQAPGWVKAEHARNVARPVLYASVSAMDGILADLAAAGIKRDTVRLWPAHYKAGEHICGPATCKLMSVAADGTQWRDDAPGVGGSKVDESVLLDSFFHQPPAPVKPVDGYVVYPGSAGGFAGRAVVSHDGGKNWA